MNHLKLFPLQIEWWCRLWTPTPHRHTYHYPAAAQTSEVKPRRAFSSKIESTVLKPFYTMMAAGLISFVPCYAEKCDVEPLFSPQQKISDAIIWQLMQAQQSVYLSLYGISNPRIVDELIHLKHQGLIIQVNVDRTQAAGRTSQVKKLKAAGIPVVIKKSHTLEHNKFMVIDYGTPNARVLFGSWNFSKSADEQDNSAAVITGCPNVIKAFKQDFDYISRRDSGK